MYGLEGDSDAVPPALREALGVRSVGDVAGYEVPGADHTGAQAAQARDDEEGELSISTFASPSEESLAIHSGDSASKYKRAYLPTEHEVGRARETVGRLEAALGPDVLAGGEFIDAAMLGTARQTVAIADRYGTSAP